MNPIKPIGSDGTVRREIDDELPKFVIDVDGPQPALTREIRARVEKAAETQAFEEAIAELPRAHGRVLWAILEWSLCRVEKGCGLGEPPLPRRSG